MMTMTLRIAAAVAALHLGGCATTPRPAPTETPPDRTAQAPAQEPASTAAESTRPVPVPHRPFAPRGAMQRVVLADAQKPVLTFRLVFHAGSVDDPAGKEGLTSLTAEVMTRGGTQQLTASQLDDVLFPMAAELDVLVDKELTVFSGRIHQDHLDRFLEIFTDVLVSPRFDPREFERLRADAVHLIQNELRGQDDELLGKVALEAMLFEGHPYAHFTHGTVQGLSSLTLDDVRQQAQRVFTRDRLVIGLAGNVTPELQARLEERLQALPENGAPQVALPTINPQAGRVWLLEKPVLSTAISMGYAYPVRRGDPDFVPLAVALSYLGEHRQFNGVLFKELREKRGLNYGNYAYPEHFIQEGWSTFARPNIARSQQDFTIWIRPVKSQHALFATRAGVHFLDRLVKEGIPADQFELTRGFLTGYTRLWEQSDSRRLGFALDELFYGTPGYLESFRRRLQTVTREQVHAAVRRHLSAERLNFVFVGPDAQSLEALLREQPPSPVTYEAQRPPEVLEADQRIIRRTLPVVKDRIQRKNVVQFLEK
jgi:zinc protease